ncbi:MAG TPA: aspartate--tRNA(Asn) ligase [Chloroflexota bacterium]
MARIWSSELAQHVGEWVRLSGWLHRFRQLSEVSFLILRDAHGLAQVVIEDAAQIATLADLPNETVLHVDGLVVAVAQAPGGVELHDPSMAVISTPHEPPPFDLYRPTIKALLPTILDHAPLSLRHLRRRAYFRLMAASAEGYRAALRQAHFVEIFTPKLVESATEGGANVFKLDYFGRPAFLAQSPQFYKQVMVGVFERVFETGPVFRAEPHDTPRHLNQYLSLDFEMGFIDDHFDVMRQLTPVLASMVQSMREQVPQAIQQLGVTLPDVPHEIPWIDFQEAQELIERDTHEQLRGEPDLAPAHERWLGEWAKREHNSDFVFVTGYPMAKRPFYTYPDPTRPDFTNSFDLLFRGLELVTGGQRLHLYQDYLAALEQRGQSPEPFDGYLQAFKYGMPPHGGCALGLERWVARIAEVANVRETTLFPRDMNRLSP